MCRVFLVFVLFVLVLSRLFGAIDLLVWLKQLDETRHINMYVEIHWFETISDVMTHG